MDEQAEEETGSANDYDMANAYEHMRGTPQEPEFYRLQEVPEEDEEYNRMMNSNSSHCMPR